MDRADWMALISDARPTTLEGSQKNFLRAKMQLNKSLYMSFCLSVHNQIEILPSLLFPNILWITKF